MKLKDFINICENIFENTKIILEKNGLVLKNFLIKKIYQEKNVYYFQ